jgi:RNA polymerase sigma-70 factor (ECF subfamily)
VPLLSREEIERAYREYQHSVLRRAKQVLGNEQAAGEVVQEVFVSLIRDPGQFRGESSLCTWLYSATTHCCLNMLRDRDTRARLLALRFGGAGEADTGAARLEDHVAARALLARLPEKLARVAIYHYFDGLTQHEIAALLGCSRRNVGKMLARVAALAADDAGSVPATGGEAAE